MPTKKSLGQHWLKDRLILEAIADSVTITPCTTVLEIGPGLGTLTSVLLKRAKEVVAVEYDEELAAKLPGQFPGKLLTVLNADFLTFDLTTLPSGYVVVANVPYYITAKIVQRLIRAENKPREMALLVQKEVAEKLCAGPGALTSLAIEAQLLYNVQLGTAVQKEYFLPPPKVDSQVVVFKDIQLDKDAQKHREHTLMVVQAGFSNPRKKLRTALAGGLRISKESVDDLLDRSGVDGNMRAQDVALDEWRKLATLYV